jgi:phage replication-related protein YjqB (UPF0714/DUF867 family)
MGRKYASYNELRGTEREGLDYRVRVRTGLSGIALMAPHGGEIEPGTTEIAEAVAGREHAFYSFEGLKPDHNLDLHIASTLFDEPRGLGEAAGAATVITVHGCRERTPVVLVGGLDKTLRKALASALEEAGFAVREDPRLPGRSPLNLCNRSARGRGVQLEVSRGLRRTLFPGLTRSDRKAPLPRFERLVAALRRALSARAGGRSAALE